MQVRWKLAIIFGTLAAFLMVELWAVLRHWYWLSVPVGFFSSPVMYSVMLKVITGRWPDWRGVWRMYRGQ